MLEFIFKLELQQSKLRNHHHHHHHQIWWVSFLFVLMYIDPARNHNLEEELTKTIFLKSFLNNFPVALLGKELTNVTRLIFLYGETYNHGKRRCSFWQTKYWLFYQFKFYVIKITIAQRTWRHLFCDKIYYLCFSKGALRPSYHKSYWDLTSFFIRVSANLLYEFLIIKYDAQFWQSSIGTHS